jgi:hypothetical protein
MAITTATSSDTATAAPVIRPRFTPSIWTLLAAESIIVAGLLHVIVGVQNLGEYLLFAVLFLGIGPLQMLFGTMVARGVRPVVAVLALVAAVALIALYIQSREAIVTRAVAQAPGGSPRSTDLPATILLMCELIAVGGLGAVVPATVRTWIVRSLLTVGVVFWLAWFWLFFA